MQGLVFSLPSLSRDGRLEVLAFRLNLSLLNPDLKDKLETFFQSRLEVFRQECHQARYMVVAVAAAAAALSSDLVHCLFCSGCKGCDDDEVDAGNGAYGILQPSLYIASVSDCLC